ncbi:cell surface protein [Penaeus vannamei]|uniref:Cell surface protein n=1 Tax=Penaeus vannamei TaxID=6689 RepID=A0A3R7N003_PENVA|nr:cell surface protein [Penaeus vannamei]
MYPNRTQHKAKYQLKAASSEGATTRIIQEQTRGRDAQPIRSSNWSNQMTPRGQGSTRAPCGFHVGSKASAPNGTPRRELNSTSSNLERASHRTIKNIGRHHSALVPACKCFLEFLIGPGKGSAIVGDNLLRGTRRAENLTKQLQRTQSISVLRATTQYRSLRHAKAKLLGSFEVHKKHKRGSTHPQINVLSSGVSVASLRVPIFPSHLPSVSLDGIGPDSVYSVLCRQALQLKDLNHNLHHQGRRPRTPPLLFPLLWFRGRPLYSSLAFEAASEDAPSTLPVAFERPRTPPLLFPLPSRRRPRTPLYSSVAFEAGVRGRVASTRTPLYFPLPSRRRPRTPRCLRGRRPRTPPLLFPLLRGGVRGRPLYSSRCLRGRRPRTVLRPASEDAPSTLPVAFEAASEDAPSTLPVAFEAASEDAPPLPFFEAGVEDAPSTLPVAFEAASETPLYSSRCLRGRVRGRPRCLRGRRPRTPPLLFPLPSRPASEDAPSTLPVAFEAGVRGRPLYSSRCLRGRSEDEPASETPLYSSRCLRGRRPRTPPLLFPLPSTASETPSTLPLPSRPASEDAPSTLPVAFEAGVRGRPLYSSRCLRGRRPRTPRPFPLPSRPASEDAPLLSRCLRGRRPRTPRSRCLRPRTPPYSSVAFEARPRTPPLLFPLPSRPASEDAPSTLPVAFEAASEDAPSTLPVAFEAGVRGTRTPLYSSRCLRGRRPRTPPLLFRCLRGRVRGRPPTLPVAFEAGVRGRPARCLRGRRPRTPPLLFPLPSRPASEDAPLPVAFEAASEDAPSTLPVAFEAASEDAPSTLPVAFEAGVRGRVAFDVLPLPSRPASEDAPSTLPVAFEAGVRGRPLYSSRFEAGVLFPLPSRPASEDAPSTLPVLRAGVEAPRAPVASSSPRWPSRPASEDAPLFPLPSRPASEDAPLLRGRLLYSSFPFEGRPYFPLLRAGVRGRPPSTLPLPSRPASEDAPYSSRWLQAGVRDASFPLPSRPASEDAPSTLPVAFEAGVRGRPRPFPLPSRPASEDAPSTLPVAFEAGVRGLLFPLPSRPASEDAPPSRCLEAAFPSRELPSRPASRTPPLLFRCLRGRRRPSKASPPPGSPCVDAPCPLPFRRCLPLPSTSEDAPALNVVFRSRSIPLPSRGRPLYSSVAFEAGVGTPDDVSRCFEAGVEDAPSTLPVCLRGRPRTPPLLFPLPSRPASKDANAPALENARAWSPLHWRPASDNARTPSQIPRLASENSNAPAVDNARAWSPLRPRPASENACTSF